MAGEMGRKLRENRGTGKHHWRETGYYWLLTRLRDEIEELRDAIALSDDPEMIWAEAADVANFAAMIADRAEWLKSEGKRVDGR
jgi:NTP pyrophosphatase (non-canonical NTP hydrolase)